MRLDNNVISYSRFIGNIRVLPDAFANQALHAYSDGHVSRGREIAAVRRAETRGLLPAQRSKLPAAECHRSIESLQDLWPPSPSPPSSSATATAGPAGSGCERSAGVSSTSIPGRSTCRESTAAATAAGSNAAVGEGSTGSPAQSSRSPSREGIALQGAIAQLPVASKPDEPVRLAAAIAAATTSRDGRSERPQDAVPVATGHSERQPVDRAGDNTSATPPNPSSLADVLAAGLHAAAAYQKQRQPAGERDDRQ